MPLLKTAPELLSQAHDLVLRGDYQGAQSKYSDAARRYAKSGDAGNAALANAYAGVIAIHNKTSDPTAYRQAVQLVQPLGTTPLKLGLREAPATQISAEATLLAEELESTGFHPSTAEQYRQKALALQNLSVKFRSQIGDQVMILSELFRMGTTKGNQKALPLAAQAEEALGESLIGTDPKAAAEHYQSARLWWAQAGFSGSAEAALARTRAYSRSAKCWFCGREVTGEGVHFLAMTSDLTELLRRSGGDSVLAAFDPSSNAVYACKGCHTAFYRLADQLAVQRMQELEARVRVQLDDLRRQIAALHAAVQSIRR